MHCAALICRSASGVLIKPFQTSFLLQPAHQEAPCAARSTINWHGFAEAAGDPSYGHCLEVAVIIPVTYGNWGEMLSSLVPFPCTQHKVTAISGNVSAVAINLFVLKIASPLQNSAVPSDLLPSCCSTSLLADDLLCELDNLPLCVKFRCYSVRLSFLSCSFLFHEERQKIRRRNRSASLISFLIVWTQIKHLPFFLLLSSAGIEWIKFNLEVLKQMNRMLFSYQALLGVMG